MSYLLHCRLAHPSIDSTRYLFQCLVRGGMRCLRDRIEL